MSNFLDIRTFLQIDVVIFLKFLKNGGKLFEHIFKNEFSPRKMKKIDDCFFKVHLLISENRSGAVSERFRQFKDKKTRGNKNVQGFHN